MANPSSETQEFLALLGGAGAKSPDAAEPEVPAASQPANPDDSSNAGTVSVQSPASYAPPTPALVDPIKIKGGPRPVRRRDGLWPTPQRGYDQKRFEFSSGHELFKPQKTVKKGLSWFFAILACVVLVTCLLIGAVMANQNSTDYGNHSVVGTTAYDSWLSLTPADDGGYYMVFLVTEGNLDSEGHGKLKHIYLYRTMKDATGPLLTIDVPANTYLAATSQYPVRTIAWTLENKNIAQTLRWIDTTYGMRLYNVICTDETTYANMRKVMETGASVQSLSDDVMLGHVWSDLTLEEIRVYLTRIAAIEPSERWSFSVPYSELQIADQTMAVPVIADFLSLLRSYTGTAAEPVLDDYGCPVGTQYDEDGRPILDERGFPVGALVNSSGALVYDENGYLQFYGMQYDDKGNPLGTQYDSEGRPLLDDRNNPLGTQYGEDGEPLVDWRGNLVIINE